MRRIALFLWAAALPAQSPEQVEFFEKKIRPVLATHCGSCHGPKTQMAGYNFTTSDTLRAVAKGDPDRSRLYLAVRYTEKVKMPPAGKISETEIADIRAWIDSGAVWPGAEAAPAPVTSPGTLTEAQRAHWSFQKVKRHAPPAVRDTRWPANPIDQFILARLEEKGMKPAAPASKPALLRRVTFDLTGLPPTPEELAGFLADDSPDAFAKVVDRLLASPHYGERWGRHWLDVARYADSTGMDEDHIYPHGWRYRDYVIDAFNRDLPFDRFIVEQIAGDLLPDSAPVATGFLALGPKPLAQQDRVKMVYDVVDEQIDVTSKAFLGLTVACARCHDHKFDPILTKDYYSLASIFASTKSFRNNGRPGAVSYIYYAPLDRAAYDRWQAHRKEMNARRLEMERAAAEESLAFRTQVAKHMVAAWRVAHQGASKRAQNVDPVDLERWICYLESGKPHLKDWREATSATIAQVAAKYEGGYRVTAEKWDERIDRWLRLFEEEVRQDRDLPARPVFDDDQDPFFAQVTFKGGPFAGIESDRLGSLRAQWKRLEETLPDEPPMASAVADGPVIEQRVFVRGDHHSPGEPVSKRFPLVLAGIEQPATRGSGRLELGRWLASPENPLTARVMVNRIWQWHFGEGLVRTPNNWGRTGERPTHPELLDYLAGRFIESGWSVKAMHRTILLSSVYRMSTRTSGTIREADPGNRLWSRFNRQRLSVEQIRDSFLVLGGSLDPKLGGSLLPEGKKRRQAQPDDVLRRTVYIPVRRGSIPVVLATFDFGDATTPSDGRSRTNVAPQALFMMNSEFASQRALGFAKRLLDRPDLHDSQRIERAYLQALARNPSPEETDGALSYVSGLEKRLSSEVRLTAWQSFCRVLMATNEFLYLE